MGRDDDDDDVEKGKSINGCNNARSNAVESSSSRDTSRGDESTGFNQTQSHRFDRVAEKSQPKFSTKSLRTLRKS